MSKSIDKKIKILQIITCLDMGGAQEHIMHLCDLLDKDKFQMTILSGKQCISEKDCIEEVRGKNIRLVQLPQMTREINPARDLLAFFGILRYLMKERFDIVHTNSSKAGILGRLAAKLAGVPIIVHTVHGWGHHNYMSQRRKRFYIILERISATYTDRIIAVSKLNVEKGLNDKIGNRPKYCVIRSGIELNKFKHIKIDKKYEKEKWSINPSDKVVGSITRLFPQKSPEDFILMANKILKNHSNISFVLVGVGPLRDQIKSLIAEFRISNKVMLTGFQSDIPELLSIMDVFVLTSLWEGLPRVLPQAMAMGIPIVATQVDGVPEAVKHGENGFLVPPKDFHALAERTLQLIQNPSLAKKMGETGKKMVDPEFCIKEMVRKTEQLYEDLFMLRHRINHDRI
jgi:glycosyltransferase involved in cell wall biosynthesis